MKTLPFILVAWAAVIVIAVAGIALLVSNVAGGNSSSYKVEGTLTLANIRPLNTPGTPCAGSGGYDDIRASAQVIVKDQDGKTIGTSQLGPGTQTQASDCLFTFTVSGLPKAEFYSVEVSHRGALSWSFDELKAKGWTVALSLGQ